MFFPITPFGESMEVCREVLREHVEQRLSFRPGAVFAAGGAGEFHALAATEMADIVATVVDVVGGQVPVFSGTGGPLGHAVACARSAAELGADGLLVLPPYLAEFAPAGLVAYVESVADSVDLPVILYHRGRARYDLASVQWLMSDRQVVGIKDGRGDLDLMRAVLAHRDATNRSDFMVLNGMPTAEVRDAEYRRAGIPTYSSSTFAMAPSIAMAYHDAARRADDATCTAILEAFFLPFDRLRQSKPGYSVALVKAGVVLGGLSAGPVRPPLLAVEPDDLESLRRLLSVGTELATS